MRLTIERSHLLKSLQHVQSVVERRNTIPILSNLLIASEDSQLSLTATDMDIAVVDSSPSEVGQAGATTAPAHMLYDIVRKLPEGAQVEIATEDGTDRLSLRTGRASFSLHCLPTEDFPVVLDGDVTHQFALPAKELRRLIDKTRFAISTEETRYYLNGIYLHAIEEADQAVLRAVATDGHRLARVEVALPAGAQGMPGVIVPRKAIAELRKLLDDFDEEVQIALSDVKVRFVLGTAILSSKLIDGTFPDYERVIPQGNDKIMTVHGKQFSEAVDRVSTIASDKSRAIKLSLADDKVVLSASSPDQASAIEELAVDYGGEAIDIGFNSRYVLDMTQQIEGDSLRFEMADAASPTVVSDSDDPLALYVLMPMRV
jgi:DNA polymerase-3 subunit beta